MGAGDDDFFAHAKKQIFGLIVAGQDQQALARDAVTGMTTERLALGFVRDSLGKAAHDGAATAVQQAFRDSAVTAVTIAGDLDAARRRFRRDWLTIVFCCLCALVFSAAIVSWTAISVQRSDIERLSAQKAELTAEIQALQHQRDQVSHNRKPGK